MSSSRRSSNAESGTTFQRRIPDSYPDNYRDRGRDQDRNFRGDNSFYHPGFARSRDRNRTLDHDRPGRSNSFGENAELGRERPRLLSRQSMQDHRSLTRQSPSPNSMRNSRQSSPKASSGNRPISPNGHPPPSGAATPITANTSSALPSKPLVLDKVAEASAASLKADPLDKVAMKDPRLRRISTKVKPNSEIVNASPAAASPGPAPSAVNKLAPDTDQPKVTETGFVDPTSNPLNPQSFSPANPDTPFPGPCRVATAVSALSEPTLRKPSSDDMDVTMTDVNQTSTVIHFVPEIPSKTTQPPQLSAATLNLMESFVKMMTDFADQVSSTSILKYKRDIAKQKSSRCKYNDERNRKNFKDYPVTIEQGAQARQLAEQELVSVDKKLKDHVKVQNELARAMAGHLVSQIERQKCAQDTDPDQARIVRQSLEKVERLSANVTTTLAEMKQAKQSAAKSVKEACELVERATSTCREAQQAAQKAFTQVNEVTGRVNELSRSAATLHKDVSEDQAQIVKVMNLVEHLEDNMKSLCNRTADAEDDVDSLRKRTAHAEDDIKNLWDDKAQSAVLEGLRKEVNGDIAHFKNMQKDLATHMKSLEANMKAFHHLYETLAPEVKTHSKKIEELNMSLKTPDTNDPKRLYGIEIPDGDAPKHERSECLVQDLQSDIGELQQSFKDLSDKFQSLATQSDLATLRNSIAGLQVEVENLNAAEILKDLGAYRKDAEADREELRDLTKEVDELHAGQDQIRDTFTAHNEGIAMRVDKAEKDIHDVSLELKETFDKAKEENQDIAKQLDGVSKRVEATMTAATTRPTPPSAPRTPQMHQAAQLPGRRSSSPIVENGAVVGRLNEVARDLMKLNGYINGQFSTSPNLPATLNSLGQAVMNLQSRYNNLTTEPVVRAMVQQMNLMYPYASTAQNEIRVVRTAVSHLEKLPPKIDLLNTQVGVHTNDIANLDQKINDQGKERVSSDSKQERLVMHVKEERDNLKQHVEDQHGKLKQDVEKRYDQLDERITAVEKESVSSVTEVAAKVTKLEEVANLWNTAKRAERMFQLSDEETTPKAVAQLQANGPTSSSSSARDHHRPSNQTSTGRPEESDREARPKQFDASAHRRKVVPRTIVSDTDDSDTPLAASRAHSSKSIATASLNGHEPGDYGRRKRAHDASKYDEERAPMSEILSSPSKKVARHL